MEGHRDSLTDFFFFLFVIYGHRVIFRYSFFFFFSFFNVGQGEDIKCVIVESGKKTCFQKVLNLGTRLGLPLQCSVSSVNMERVVRCLLSSRACPAILMT